MVIVMLTVGALYFMLFLIIEWKVSPLPMMPSTLYATGKYSTNRASIYI